MTANQLIFAPDAQAPALKRQSAHAFRPPSPQRFYGRFEAYQRALPGISRVVCENLGDVAASSFDLSYKINDTALYASFSFYSASSPVTSRIPHKGGIVNSCDPIRVYTPHRLHASGGKLSLHPSNPAAEFQACRPIHPQDAPGSAPQGRYRGQPYRWRGQLSTCAANYGWSGALGQITQINGITGYFTTISRSYSRRVVFQNKTYPFFCFRLLARHFQAINFTMLHAIRYAAAGVCGGNFLCRKITQKYMGQSARVIKPDITITVDIPIGRRKVKKILGVGNRFCFVREFTIICAKGWVAAKNSQINFVHFITPTPDFPRRESQRLADKLNATAMRGDIQALFSLFINYFTLLSNNNMLQFITTRGYKSSLEVVNDQ